MRAARAAGRTPQSCAPANPDLTPDDLIAHLRTISPARRKSTSVKAAIYGMMRKLYPCPAG
jgi:hypothetical protein